MKNFIYVIIQPENLTQASQKKKKCVFFFQIKMRITTLSMLISVTRGTEYLDISRIYVS